MNPKIDTDGNLEAKKSETTTTGRVYSLGQYFEKDDEYYILVKESIGFGMLCLNDGVWWADPVTVQDPVDITEEELKTIVGDDEADGWRFIGDFNDFLRVMTNDNIIIQ